MKTEFKTGYNPENINHLIIERNDNNAEKAKINSIVWQVKEDKKIIEIKNIDDLKSLEDFFKFFSKKVLLQNRHNETIVSKKISSLVLDSSLCGSITIHPYVAQLLSSKNLFFEGNIKNVLTLSKKISKFLKQHWLFNKKITPTQSTHEALNNICPQTIITKDNFLETIENVLKKIPRGHDLYFVEAGLRDLIFQFILDAPQNFLDSCNRNEFFSNFAERVKENEPNLFNPIFMNNKNKILEKIKNLGTPKINLPTEKVFHPKNKTYTIDRSICDRHKNVIESDIFLKYYSTALYKQQENNLQKKERYRIFIQGFKEQSRAANIPDNQKASYLTGQILHFIITQKIQLDESEECKKFIYVFNRSTAFANIESLNTRVMFDVTLSEKINDIYDLNHEANKLMLEYLKKQEKYHMN
jgi:hypothetical protein